MDVTVGPGLIDRPCEKAVFYFPPLLYLLHYPEDGVTEWVSESKGCVVM